MFTGIAFDSGGVASGPMTAAFLLPFAMGACEALGGSIFIRRLRRGGFGCHDATHYHPAHGPELPAQAAPPCRRAGGGTDEILEYGVSMYQTQR